MKKYNLSFYHLNTDERFSFSSKIDLFSRQKEICSRRKEKNLNMLVLASILALCAAAPADSTCPMINQRDQGLDVLPKYPLDPEKFITPIYIWGPSSQLQVNFQYSKTSVALREPLAYRCYLIQFHRVKRTKKCIRRSVPG